MSKKQHTPLQPPPLTYRQRASAHLLGVSPSCLRNWDRRGIGPKRIRLPGARAVLYSASEIESFIRRNEIDPADVASK